MEKDFDFNRIGKRMPYKTPEGFFDEMEANVWKKVQHEPAVPAKRRTFRLYTGIGITALAAGLALLFVIRPFTPDKAAGGFTQIEQAFANLSLEDQAYMLEIYQEDIFMNN